MVPWSIPDATWQWSTAGAPITTALTTQVMGAGAANVRNYMTQMYCDNSSATAGEVQILDGATIIADRFIPANATAFPVLLTAGGIPLRGSTATAMNFKTLTAAQSLYCSAEGYQAY